MMSAAWFQFKWDADLAPLQTAHCSLVGIEVNCTDAMRCMKALQSSVGNISHFAAISEIALRLIQEKLDTKVVFVIAFFRLGFEMHAQFLSEEAQRVADAFVRMPVTGLTRQLLMLEMEAVDFDRVCAVVHPAIVCCKPFIS